MNVHVHKPPHGPPGAEERLFAACFGKLEREQGIRVIYGAPAWESWSSAVMRIAGDGAAHVVYIPGGWLPALAAAGKLVDLSERLPSLTESWRREYPDAAYRMGSWKERQYGIPVYGAVWCFLYNAALFARAGIPRPPRTWEELQACARKLKQRFPDVVPYGIPDDSDGHFIDHGYVYLFGGRRFDWLDADGRLRFDRDWPVKGLDFLHGMVERGLANVPRETPSARIKAWLMEGRVAMTVGPSEWLLQQRNEHPETALRAAMMPCPAGGEPLSFSSYGFYGVLAGGGRCGIDDTAGLDGLDAAAGIEGSRSAGGIDDNGHSGDSGRIGAAGEAMNALLRPAFLERHIRAIGMLPVRHGEPFYDGADQAAVYAEQVKHSGAFPDADLSFAPVLTAEMLACLRLEKTATQALRDATDHWNRGGEAGCER